MRYLTFLVLLAFSYATMASERKPLAIAAITAQQAEIRAEAQAGAGRYKDMPVATRNELLSRQAGLLTMLEGKTSSDELTSTQRIEAFNTLEWIEATINRAEDERMVCKREKALGSNRLQQVCKTSAQIREEQEAARRTFNRGCSTGVCFEN